MHFWFEPQTIIIATKKNASKMSEDVEEGLSTSPPVFPSEDAHVIQQAEEGRASTQVKSDEEFDKEALERLTYIIREEKQDYNDKEVNAIRKGKAMYEKCMASTKIKKVISPDSQLEMKMVHLDGGR